MKDMMKDKDDGIIKDSEKKEKDVDVKLIKKKTTQKRKTLRTKEMVSKQEKSLDEKEKPLDEKKATDPLIKDDFDPLINPLIDDEMALKLEQLEMAKLDLHSTRVQLQVQIKEKLSLAVQLLGIKYQEERNVLKAKMMGCENSRIEAKDDYNAIIRDVENRFKINMSEYIVADSGVLTHEKDVG